MELTSTEERLRQELSYAMGRLNELSNNAHNLGLRVEVDTIEKYVLGSPPYLPVFSGKIVKEILANNPKQSSSDPLPFRPKR